MSETAFGADAIGVHVGMNWRDSGYEVGHITVMRWDAEQSDWASKKFGGAGTGQHGFVPPNEVMFHQLKVRPYSVTVSDPRDHNLLTTGGWDRILTLAIGGGGTSYASASARIGVGTGTTAPASGNTDLVAATGPTGRFFNLVTGNGTTSAGTAVRRLSFTATFATGDANFHWQEWCIDQGTVGSGTGATVGTMMNRAVSDQGTKVSGQTWTATANLDFT